MRHDRSGRPQGAVVQALTFAALLVSACAHGQAPAPAPAANGETVSGKPASAAFCLFEVPGGSTRKFINLGIVQYVELGADDVRIYYGGGNLGSGHEARFPLKSREDGPALIARMQKAAQDCK
jgi:hypothetical protein